MSQCIFVSDLHGQKENYLKLFELVKSEKPEALFLGGDIFPSGMFAFTHNANAMEDFLLDFIIPEFESLKANLKSEYPTVFVILGNDDGKFAEAEIINAEKIGIWNYAHMKKYKTGNNSIYGYAYIPPTPFLLKDWEKYDVSQYIDPGCISPEDGKYSIELPKNQIKYATIEKDLDLLFGDEDLSKAIILFHSPPYQTKLDRAALDNKKIDHVPLDVHVGSIAIKRFIENRQPLLTLHGHIHESARITGTWKDRIGETFLFTAAHDGPELAIVRFDMDNPDNSSRDLL